MERERTRGLYSPPSDWLRGQLLPYHSGSMKLKQSFVLLCNEMGEIDGVLLEISSAPERALSNSRQVGNVGKNK